MAFIPHKWHKGAEPWEVKPFMTIPDGAAVNVGDLFVLTDGALSRATGSIKPTFVSMQHIESPKAQQPVHVERIRPETIYETELSVDSEALAEGNKYTTTGSKLTATSASGVAEVVDYDGTTAGSKVRVRFPD